jgi:purine-binding chemotaxis protein CheW
MEQLTSRSSVDDSMQLFGSFHLGEIELALSASMLQEVVNYPSSMTRVPMGPPFLLGLFNLRGALIPIVQLAQLLQLPATDASDESKIAIIEIEGARVGLLFDRTGEILRVRGSQVIPFEQDDDQGGMIEGAIRMAGGDRILQVLAAGKLVRLRDIPRPQQSASERHDLVRRNIQAQRRQSVSFLVAGNRMALPMSAIHEIIRVPELQRSMLADERCLGLLNLRGHTVPVIDFARFLHLASTDAELTKGCEKNVEERDDERRIIVIKRNDVHLGMLVGEVESIVGYVESELLPIPSFNPANRSLFAGCISNGNERDIILIDPDVLRNDSALVELTAGHRALYEAVDGDQSGVHGDNRVVRETYVTFKLDQLMGLRIEQLREVIDYSHDLMQPPDAPDYVRGLLNLRHTLVTVVDLRALYGMRAMVDAAMAKILIVEQDGEKYGLIVDAIQNIVTIDRADKIRVPSILLNQLDNELRNDLHEVVDMPDHSTLMLLDAAPLVQRLGSNNVH